MNNEAKNALEAIKILLEEGEDEYLEALCITIIQNLPKRAVADYKQYLKDQQENAVEIWKLVDSRNKEKLPNDYATKEEAEMHINELRESLPNLGYYNYEPMLFKGVMDNE